MLPPPPLCFYSLYQNIIVVNVFFVFAAVKWCGIFTPMGLRTTNPSSGGEKTATIVIPTAKEHGLWRRMLRRKVYRKKNSRAFLLFLEKKMIFFRKKKICLRPNEKKRGKKRRKNVFFWVVFAGEKIPRHQCETKIRSPYKFQSGVSLDRGVKLASICGEFERRTNGKSSFLWI